MFLLSQTLFGSALRAKFCRHQSYNVLQYDSFICCTWFYQHRIVTDYNLDLFFRLLSGYFCKNKCALNNVHLPKKILYSITFQSLESQSVER
jgi:hypothetical protein